jgi:hypothetical protein
MLKLASRTSKWFYIASISMAMGGCTVGNDRNDVADEKNADVEDARIVGGADADIADLPWQISMQTQDGFHFCGGTILNAEWILSAGHCVDGTDPGSVRIVAGFTKQSQLASGQIRQVTEIISYPGYVSPEQGKDASLLHLASPLDLSDPLVSAIELVTEADAAAGLTDPGVISTVSGWGTLRSNGSSPDTLQRVDIPLLSNADVQASYTNETITDDQLGAGIIGVGGVDACQGDSGGPLVVPNADGTGYKLAGIVSWGYGCADRRYPGLYGRVSSFATWITDTAGAGDSTDPDPKPEPPTTDKLLEETNLSGKRSEWTDFTVQVPAGASALEVITFGGTGDVDLYVAPFLPTTSQYECRSYRSKNDEACTIQNPAEGEWYVSLRGYRNYNGANVTARAVP